MSEPMKCPRCGLECDRDEVDVGVGVIYGPFGCYCGWSEDPRYDQATCEQPESGHRDQWGGYTSHAKGDVYCGLCNGSGQAMVRDPGCDSLEPCERCGGTGRQP